MLASQTLSSLNLAIVATWVPHARLIWTVRLHAFGHVGALLMSGLWTGDFGYCLSSKCRGYFGDTCSQSDSTSCMGAWTYPIVIALYV